MVKACNLKKSMIVEINGEPHMVEQIQVQTPSARGGATLYKVRLRHAATRQRLNQTLRGDDTLQEADFETREVQYLYKSGDRYAFMDLETYDQFELTEDDAASAIPYLIEDMEGINALMSDGRVLALNMPDVVELQIAECEPSIKGASATARTKPATLSTGLVVQVPEYIAPEDTIRIDTRSDTFLSRA